jgi:hypothetical protein
MSNSSYKNTQIGRLRSAPENFISSELMTDIRQNGLDETRRGFLKKSFLTALGAATSAVAVASEIKGDPAILEVQPWVSLGQPIGCLSSLCAITRILWNYYSKRFALRAPPSRLARYQSSPTSLDD